MFRFRKLADYSDGSSRVVRYDTITGERILVDPADGQPKAWPLLGVAVEGEVRVLDKIGMDYVLNAVNEGWASMENKREVHRPGGPANNPWATTHTFHQADQITFHVLVDGVKKDLVYKVISQPDKYEDASEFSGWRVDWTYELELVTA